MVATDDDPHAAVLLSGTANAAAAVSARTAAHVDFVNPTAAEIDQPGHPWPTAPRGQDAATAAATVTKRLGTVTVDGDAGTVTHANER